MVRMIAILCAFFTCLIAAAPARAATGSQLARPNTAVVTFRLQVSGRPAPRTTFWVAYGPLNGRWGILQLKDRGSGLYTTAQRLPTSGRSTFYYLSGRGTMRTRLGVVPGNPVATIRQVGPTSVWPSGLPLVRWSARAG